MLKLCQQSLPLRTFVSNEENSCMQQCITVRDPGLEDARYFYKRGLQNQALDRTSSELDYTNSISHLSMALENVDKETSM